MTKSTLSFMLLFWSIFVVAGGSQSGDEREEDESPSRSLAHVMEETGGNSVVAAIRLLEAGVSVLEQDLSNEYVARVSKALNTLNAALQGKGILPSLTLKPNADTATLLRSPLLRGVKHEGNQLIFPERMLPSIKQRFLTHYGEYIDFSSLPAPVAEALSTFYIATSVVEGYETGKKESEAYLAAHVGELSTPLETVQSLVNLAFSTAWPEMPSLGQALKVVRTNTDLYRRHSAVCEQVVAAQEQCRQKGSQPIKLPQTVEEQQRMKESLGIDLPLHKGYLVADAMCKRIETSLQSVPGAFLGALFKDFGAMVQNNVFVFSPRILTLWQRLQDIHPHLLEFSTLLGTFDGLGKKVEAGTATDDERTTHIRLREQAVEVREHPLWAEHKRLECDLKELSLRTLLASVDGVRHMENLRDEIAPLFAKETSRTPAFREAYSLDAWRQAFFDMLRPRFPGLQRPKVE